MTSVQKQKQVSGSNPASRSDRKSEVQGGQAPGDAQRRSRTGAARQEAVWRIVTAPTNQALGSRSPVLVQPVPKGE